MKNQAPLDEMKRFRYPHATAIFLLLGLILSFNSFAQPANDECSAAITLTSSTSCVNTAGTNVNATYNPSSLPAPGCGAADKFDVWYTFVAQASTHTITISSGPSQVRVQLLSGTCGSFTSVTCGNTSITATTLIPGNTYYIRVYTQNPNTGNFNICVTHSPPPNDNCAGATSLSSNSSCVNTAATLNLATADGTTPLGCLAPGTYYDVWFSFVAANTTETVAISSLGANITNPQIQIYGGSCAGLTNLSACGTTSITQSGLTIGSTYYVRVANLGSSPSGAGSVADFNICVTHTAPANDLCTGAISLTQSSSCVNTAGTLVGATYSTISTIGCGTASRNDVWYSFTATSTNATIALSSAPTNPRLQLFSGTCGSLTSITCGAGTLTTTGLTIGNTYYVRVYTDPNVLTGTFNICVATSTVANDNCNGAISLVSGSSCSSILGTLNSSTVSTGLPAGCESIGAHFDVWYSFVALAATETVTISGLGSNITNSEIQLYSGTCGALTSLACHANTIIQGALIVGSTYYVRVSNVGSDPSGSGSVSDFNICVTHTGLVNDDCANAITITSGYTCTNTSGTLVGSTYIAIPDPCGTGGGGGSKNDVWYSFIAQSATPTITLNTSVGQPRIQIYSGTCGGLVSLACGTPSPTYAPPGISVGTTYYVRVFSNNNSSGTFDICITDPGPPANDNCSGAILLPASSTTCTTTAGTIAYATGSSPSVGSTCGGIPGADVWYSFVAQSPFPTISLSSIGASLSSATTYIQLLSGNCGVFTSLSCVSGTGSTLSLLAGGTGLTIGNTYYVRIYTSSANPTSGAWTYNICITNPGTGSSATIDYSKSYINVTKLTTGGGVEPGDILEIRATFVVRGGTVDSLAFYDTLQNNSGFTLLSSSIVERTNEGKIYRRDSPVKSEFTDAPGDDAGWYTAVGGGDTAIQINIGIGASAYARGRLSNTSRPSVYGNTCIIMATYRVQVYAGYDQKINWGGGVFTYKDGSNMKMVSFKNDSLVVYVSPGLCSSSLSDFNQVGIESNGTFGTPATGPPLPRNRGTSTAVPSYTYRAFATGQGPNDYYYAIPNNTSATYTTLNTFPKSTAGVYNPVPQRLFSHWDITGDHTGAANTAKGNPPCDTTLPVSAANPCGYMLVVNAAYKTDTAFRSTITALCPNTYYEISAWIKNVCYKCGCDSNGVGAANANPAYIPLATGDSSGVQPNLAFQINGQDYYTTGNMAYTGTGGGITQQASDSMNTWVKRGFVYKTGPAQTGFELLIRNNAPGGGGNDWAIDDIVVATCSPEVAVTPGPEPFVCDSNTIDIGAIISSYFDTYTYYTWEKSIDNGVTWTSTGVSGGPVSPTFGSGSWNYSVDYPTFIAYGADSGSMYRVQVASTVSNLSNSSCRFSGGATIALTVGQCSPVLGLDILSFKGRNESNKSVLYWTVSKEEEPIKYEIQKSKDASRFVSIGEVPGFKDPSAVLNQYTYTDPEPLDNTLSWYRIKAIKTQDNKYKYSKVVQLIGDKAGFQIESLINPFKSDVRFDLISGVEGLVQVQILDQYQHRLKTINYNLVKGKNKIIITNTDNLPAGFYILKVISGSNVINRKIIKRS